MTLVLDASVLLAALLNTGPKGRWAEAIIDAHRLIAPELVVLEAMSGLRRLERVGEVSLLQANMAQRAVTRLAMELVPIAPFADRIWTLRHNLMSYDAAYVAVAEALTLPVATLDARMAASVEANSDISCTFLIP